MSVSGLVLVLCDRARIEPFRLFSQALRLIVTDVNLCYVFTYTGFDVLAAIAALVRAYLPFPLYFYYAQRQGAKANKSKIIYWITQRRKGAKNFGDL